MVKEIINKIKEKLFGCEHIWLNKSQEDTCNTMIKPPMIVIETSYSYHLNPAYYLGTTIKDKCAKCGEERIDRTKEKIREIILENKSINFLGWK